MTDNTNEEGKKRVTNARAIFYKKPIKKDNYRLEADEDTPQEIRRQTLLLRQKKRRDDCFNNARGLIEEVISNYQDDADDEEEEMEVETHNKNKKRKYRRNNLMLSEWMLEVPEDFFVKWTMVPCPVGKRSLLVATKGVTKAYNRHGKRVAKFQSALPGGNMEHVYHRFTLLDCIWQPLEKVYYVLDVLVWSNQGFIHCDTDCRFFWVQSKLQESNEFKECNSRNEYPLVALPRVHCNADLSEFIANTAIHFPKLDGILFYHRDGHYTSGQTPLVTWLKSFMLSEMVGISVPEKYDSKPDGYIDALHFLSTKARRKRQASVESSMDFDTAEH